ncbi:unnamed protein product [Musa textilis]
MVSRWHTPRCCPKKKKKKKKQLHGEGKSQSPESGGHVGIQDGNFGNGRRVPHSSVLIKKKGLDYFIVPLNSGKLTEESPDLRIWSREKGSCTRSVGPADPRESKAAENKQFGAQNIFFRSTSLADLYVVSSPE